MKQNSAYYSPIFAWLTWAWITVLVILPFLMVLGLSFLSRGTYGGIEFKWTLVHYVKIFSEDYFPLVYNVFLRSFWFAAMTTVAAILISYPLSLILIFKVPKYRRVLFFILIIPFWTNFLIRTYAWFALLSDTGWLIQSMQYLGIEIKSLNLLFTPKAILIAMIYNYFPFLFMSLYIGLEKLDKKIVEAAYDLGASSFKVFKDIIFPLTKPALVSGSVMVFIPALGEFVIPEILGGGRQSFIGSLLSQQYLQARNWPLGSAISILLIVMIGLSFIIIKKLFGKKVQSNEI